MNPNGNTPNNNSNQPPNNNGNNNTNTPNNNQPQNNYPQQMNYPSWSPHPPNGSYGQQLPPNSQAGQPITPSVMQPPVDRYLPPVYAPGYPQPQMGGYPPTQPAPRQRTAIACRYCRRRKIRCSGFDQSEDGRCTNCVRFSQECIFTPVSAQTQAFVPAHALYRGQNAPANQPLYGAYGQPLPPHANRDQQQQQQYPPQQPGQYPPPPQGYQQQGMYPQQPPPPGAPQMQGTNSDAGRKRPNDEPHTPTLPPPNPGAQAQMPQQRGPGGEGYGYPDPSGHPPAGASPASSTTTSYPSYPPQPYYTQPMAQARRASPQSTYSYDGSRASSSPHTLGPPGTPNSFHQPGMPLSRDGRAPPTSAAAANGHRPGGQVNGLVGQAKLEGRTFTDSNMVQALNRGPK